MKSIAAIGLAAILSLGWLSGNAMNSEKTIAITPAPAQAVEDFHFFGRLNSWRAIDKDTLIVWATPL